tara:strand:+ start:4961 stop:5644 length:684 start_codon:yes stop_codon:yes gene_type:complete
MKKIVDSIKLNQAKRKHFTWVGVEVFIKDEITNKEVSVQNALKEILKRIPKHFLVNLDTLYIGDFEFLNNREVQAMYENSSIFITNRQDDEEDMIDDIIHEIAHSLEEVYSREIYEDGKLEKEFLQKRKNLYQLISAEGFDVSINDFLKTEYSKEFDNFLYQEVGYSFLSMLSSGLYYSPYAATSLREYFANGFEALYCHRDSDFLNTSCPVLFNKLIILFNMEDLS